MEEWAYPEYSVSQIRKPVLLRIKAYNEGCLIDPSFCSRRLCTLEKGDLKGGHLGRLRGHGLEGRRFKDMA